MGSPGYQRLSQALNRTNFLRILGKTDRERWHSAFWTWVLDPAGSHGLGDYGVRRLLSRLVDGDGRLRGVIVARGAGDSPEGMLTLSELMAFDVIESVAAPGPLTDFSEIVASSSLNEGEKTKKKGASDSARFDILLVLRCTVPPPRERPVHLVIVGEVKVFAKYDPVQLQHYSRWLHVAPVSGGLVTTALGEEFLDRLQIMEQRSEDDNATEIGVGVFIARDAHNVSPPPTELIPPWSAVTFNDLIQGVLEPMAGHPSLDQESVTLIRSYIDVAAATPGILEMPPSEHRDIVNSLLADKGHKRTLLAIARVLTQSDDEELRAGGDAIVDSAGAAGTNRAASLTPADLVRLGLASVGDRLIHKAQTPRGGTEPVFKDDLVVEIVAAERRGFAYVSGGGAAVPSGRYTAQGLVTSVYAANGGDFSGAANGALRFLSGPCKGKVLSAVYDKARQKLAEQG